MEILLVLEAWDCGTVEVAGLQAKILTLGG
jgi:hypothetical protein